MGTLLQDVRFALRNLRKTPAFPLAAIATLALGIGATTAIFSTVNAVLLRPLPYPNAQDIYAIRTALTDGRVTTGLLSPAELVRLNDPSVSIVRAVGTQAQDLTLLRDDGTPVRTSVSVVGDGFFELFGLPVTLGTAFTPEHFANNAAPVLVISTQVWRDLFSSDPGVIGKPVRFAEVTATVVGVAPAGFDTPHGAGFWFAQPMDPQGQNHSFDGYMRLKPGASIERVRGEMAAVMAGLARDFPVSDMNRVYVVRPLVDSIVGDLGPILIIVLSSTALLLLLACVNVTNLMLARGAARAREIAVRVALGASRGRIVRQLLTESIVLATAGALVGLIVANLGVKLLLSLGARQLPRLEAVTFDGRVLLFTLVTLIVSGAFVGFAPALRLARTDVRSLMNESTRSATGGRGTARWLAGMTIAEIALAVTLVAGAGWLIRGFANLRSLDPGFASESRVFFDATLIGPKYRDQPALQAGIKEVVSRVRQISGVTAAGLTSSVPLRGSQENSLYLQLDGTTLDPANPLGTRQRFVTPGFFDAMGIRLIAGRDFAEDDRADTTLVAVVNRTFVRRYLGGRDPMGVRFSSGYPQIDPRSMSTIVGVVEDVRQRSLEDAAEPAYYTSIGQRPLRRMAMVVKTATPDPVSVEQAIREEIRRFDPQIAVDFTSVPELVGGTLRRQQLGMTLMLLFGATAVALAAVGIYGVIAYASAQRRNEMATRLALGATRGDIFLLVLRQGRTLGLVGLAIGLATAYLAGRVVSSRVYAVQAADPWILSGAIAIVGLIAVAATLIPAFRASRVHPSHVLRPEA